MLRALLGLAFLSSVLPAYVPTNTLEEQIRVPAGRKDTGLEVIPEHERRLRRVLITVPARGRFETMYSTEPELYEAVYSELLAVLPEYTIIEIVVREEDSSNARPWVEKVAKTHPVKVHTVASPEVEVDFWAQDLGEPVRLDGRDCLLVSSYVDRSLDYDHKVSRYRYQVAREIFGRQSVHRAKFVFEGGNLLFDRSASGIRVLIGYNDVLMTQENYQAKGELLPLQRIALSSRSVTRGGCRPVGPDPVEPSVHVAEYSEHVP